MKLASQVVDDVRRRVQQDTTGHRGRRNDPLYRIRNILRAGQEHLTDRQRARLESAFGAHEDHVEVEVAWRCAQQVRSAYHQDTHAAGRVVAENILDSFATCPIPEVARLGRTLKQWRTEFLGYFDTDGANNDGTRPSTASSSSTAASPAASATARTTAYECCSSVEDYCPDPTLIGEEPLIVAPGHARAVLTDLTRATPALVGGGRTIIADENY